MTGWRIGYSHACPALTNLMLKIHQQINTNTAAFIQKGAVAALTGSQDHLEGFVRNLQIRAQLFKTFVDGHPLLTSSSIEGGFFGFLRIGSTGLASDAFSTRLLEETGVAVIPGVSFGSDFDEWVRVSLATHTESLVEGLSRIGAFVTAQGGAA
jgi:aminotransferase